MAGTRFMLRVLSLMVLETFHVKSFELWRFLWGLKVSGCLVFPLLRFQGKLRSSDEVDAEVEALVTDALTTGWRVA
eukprot:5751965-Amphidinium_carterae.1